MRGICEYLFARGRLTNVERGESPHGSYRPRRAPPEAPAHRLSVFGISVDHSRIGRHIFANRSVATCCCVDQLPTPHIRSESDSPSILGSAVKARPVASHQVPRYRSINRTNSSDILAIERISKRQHGHCMGDFREPVGRSRANIIGTENQLRFR